MFALPVVAKRHDTGQGKTESSVSSSGSSDRRCRALGGRRLAFITIIVTFATIPNVASSESTPLVAIAQDVVRAAGKVAVNEAGSRVLGPTAWRYFKEIFAPVWTELEKRYPALKSGDSRQAATAAEQAAWRPGTSAGTVGPNSCRCASDRDSPYPYLGELLRWTD